MVIQRPKRTSYNPVSAPCLLPPSQGRVVISDSTQRRRQADPYLTAAPLQHSLYLFLRPPGQSSPVRLVSPDSSSCTCSGHLLNICHFTQYPSPSSTLPQHWQYRPSGPLLPSSLCSHRRNHLRGAHFPPMSWALVTEVTPGSTFPTRM